MNISDEGLSAMIGNVIDYYAHLHSIDRFDRKACFKIRKSVLQLLNKGFAQLSHLRSNVEQTNKENDLFENSFSDESHSNQKLLPQREISYYSKNSNSNEQNRAEKIKNKQILHDSQIYENSIFRDSIDLFGHSSHDDDQEFKWEAMQPSESKRREMVEQQSNTILENTHRYDHKLGNKYQSVSVSQINKDVKLEASDSSLSISLENYRIISLNQAVASHQTNKLDRTHPIKKQRRQIKQRGRKPQFPLMEAKLTNWIKSKIEAGEKITQQIIRDQSKIMINDFPQYQVNNFNASKGWLQKFLKRNKKVVQLLYQRCKKRDKSGSEMVPNRRTGIRCNKRAQIQIIQLINDKFKGQKVCKSDKQRNLYLFPDDADSQISKS